MSSPLPDVVEEAQRILSSAVESGVTLRLVGGVAVRLTCPSSTKAPFRRDYRDEDFVGRSSETRKIKGLFTSLGYLPRETFNAMQGGRRLVFNDLTNGRRADIFQDYFEMSHKFDFRKRLELREETLPLADLLETKLQVVEVNDKDFKDILALLVDHDFGPEAPDSIDSSHIVGVCSNDWGIYKTFTLNLGKLVMGLDRFPLQKTERERVEAQAEELLDDIESAPKSLRWKLRERIGERVAWYQKPEADAAVVDSRF